MKRWRWSVVAAVVLLAAVLVLPVGADEVGKRPSVVRPSAVWYPTAFAVTPPVAQLPPVAPDVSGLPREVPNRPVNPAELPVLTFPDAKGPEGPPQGEGAISGSSGVYAPAPSVSFASLGSDHNQSIVGFRVAPPDTQGAVGPNHYIQWVNLVWAVYNKSGALVGGPWAGNSLWQALPVGSPCRTANDGDPITLYDHGADRWLMSQFRVGSSPYYTCLAVSQTPDPLGPWYVWQYLYSNTLMNDYPKFGVWPDGYYMTVNEFGSGQSATVVFNRAQMLAGAASPAAVYFQIEAVQPAFPQPTHWDGGAPPPPGSPNYNIAFYDDGWGNPFDLLQICSFTVNWTTPSSSTFTCPAGLTDPGIINLTSAGLPFDSNLCSYNRNCIPQQGTGQLVDALSDRLMFPANYRNLVGTLGYEVMVLTHSVDANGADRAGVRWYELRKYPSQPWTVHTGGTFSPDAHHRWMGSAAVDQNGNIGLVYSVSSSTMFPSVRYTGRLVGDPPGTMQTEGIAVAGGGHQTGVNRWGDYASIHTDPDGCAFWGTAEYVASTGNFDWDTWVVAFTMPGCTPSGFGTLSGTVINANTLAPIGGALVEAGTYSTTTQSNGTYAMNLPVGTYSVTASAFGYAPQTVPGVGITDGNTTTQDFALTPTASAELDGFVVGQPHGWPLYAKVDVKVGTTTVATTFTNPFNGYYYFASLPALQNYNLEVTSQIAGYKPGTRTIFLSAAGQSENFALAPMASAQFVKCKLQGGINEGFEGTWPPEGWTVSHDSGNPNCLWTNVSARANLTGGTGKFAIADSDACGSGSTMGTTLTSPIIDFTGIANVALQFKGEYRHLGSQVGYVEVSSNGGATWTTVLTFNTTAHRGPRTYEADVSAHWGNNANARLRFRFVSPGWNWWWMIDEVRTMVPRSAPVLYENFDSTTFPPAGGWSNFNVDGGGTTWARTTTSPYNPAGAAWHNLSTAGMQNGWLATPTITLPSSAAELSFWERATSIPNYFKHSIWVCTTGCTSPPTNWIQVADLGAATATWARRAVPLSAYAGQAVRLAFRYEGNNADAWFIDEIRVGMPDPPTYIDPTGFACTAVAGSMVAGFVKDENTNQPINGAGVENDLGGRTTTMATPNDPAIGDGFYWLFTPLPGGYGPATRTFTASFPGYGNDVEQAILPPNTTYRIDFALPAGWLVLTPTSLYSRLYSNQQEHQDLNLNNQGGLAANFQFVITAIPASWSHLSPVRSTNQPGAPPSAGPAPRVTDKPSAPPRTVPELADAVVPAFGVDVYPGSNFVKWNNVATPSAWTIIAPRPEYFFAGDFRLGDFSKLWVLNYSTNQLATINTATGAVTVIGSSMPLSGHSWTGLTAAVDGTLYAASAQCGTASQLYSVNPATGATTPVGNITNGACIIDIAATPAGDIFGVDIVTDSLIRINKNTGAGTVVGPLGIDANFAQGMDYDELNGILYWAAYNNTLSQGELRIINTTTGASTLVGAFPGGAEIGAFGIAGYIGAGLSWLVLTPSVGTAPPISSNLIDAHFIADGAPHWGTYRAEIMTLHNTSYPVPKVNVCFIKAFNDVPQGHWADKFIHAVAGARITPGAGGNFRPEDPMTRGTMARWLLRGRYGNTYAPPPCQPIFADVDCDTTPNADWIVDLYNKGITAGCTTNPLRFCPDQIVTRGQMAIFLLKAKEPAGYTPPACQGNIFNDVNCSRFRDAWIEELWRRGITSGCGGGNYCPELTTNRAQQSVFVTRAWNIPRCP